MKTIAAILVCPAVVCLVIACSTGSRDTALRVAFTTTSVADDTLAQIEHMHAEQIIAACVVAKCTGDQVREQLAVWRNTTDAIEAKIKIALTVIGAAIGLKDDAAVALVAAPVKDAADSVAKLKIETATGSNTP